MCARGRRTPVAPLLLGALTDFWRRGGLRLAASLAFFSLLSFFPLVYLLLSLASGISHHVLGREYLLGLLQGFVPEVGDQPADGVAWMAAETTVLWVAAISFVWFGYMGHFS